MVGVREVFLDGQYPPLNFLKIGKIHPGHPRTSCLDFWNNITLLLTTFRWKLWWPWRDIEHKHWRKYLWQNVRLVHKSWTLTSIFPINWQLCAPSRIADNIHDGGPKRTSNIIWRKHAWQNSRLLRPRPPSDNYHDLGIKSCISSRMLTSTLCSMSLQGHHRKHSTRWLAR